MKQHTLLALLAALLPGSLALGQAKALAGAAAADLEPFAPVPLLIERAAGGDVRVYEEYTGSLVAPRRDLRALRLLPIDFVGRTELETFFADRPRLHSDVPGATRLGLPNGRGSLYRYARSGGPTWYGFLIVDAQGDVRSLAELPGTGPSGDGDPFVDRIAVGVAGRAFLVATRLGAGGNLLEVDLTTGTVTDRTPQLGPLELSSAGLWLNPGWGFGVASDAVLRFERTSQAVAELVDLGPTPPVWFSGEAVVSRNREWAATTAGDSDTAQYVFVFGRAGSALRVGTEPAPLSGAGFLPESLAGPFLAVADDGSGCAWRVEGGTSREAFCAPVELLPQEPAQISSDDFFPDTLDEIGALGFVGVGRLVVGIGERADLEGGLEKMDLFEVGMLAESTLEFTNLTLSSGDATAPFDEALPVLKPTSMHWLPDTGGLLFHDDDSETFFGLPAGQIGLTTLLANVKSVDFVEPTPSGLLVAVRRSSGDRPRELHRVAYSVDAPADLLVAGTGDTEFFYPAARGDGWVGFVTRLLDVDEWMMRVDVATGTVRTFPGPPAKYQPPIAFTELGAQVVARGPLGGPATFFVWREGAPVPLQTPARPGHPLAGR